MLRSCLPRVFIGFVCPATSHSSWSATGVDICLEWPFSPATLQKAYCCKSKTISLILGSQATASYQEGIETMLKELTATCTSECPTIECLKYDTVLVVQMTSEHSPKDATVLQNTVDSLSSKLRVLTCLASQTIDDLMLTPYDVTVYLEQVNHQSLKQELRALLDDKEPSGPKERKLNEISTPRPPRLQRKRDTGVVAAYAESANKSKVSGGNSTPRQYSTDSLRNVGILYLYRLSAASVMSCR